MTNAFKTVDSFSAHAWCMAAGLRDGLRTAQFYIRDMSRADNRKQSALLSRLVAGWARCVDSAMTWGGNLSIALFLPSWRNMPSPFAPGLIDQVATAINQNKLLENPLFNVYFFRSSQNVLSRWAEPPYLVLEHRIDSARRNLALAAPSRNTLEFLAQALLALVETAPIAKHGPAREILKTTDDPNIAVYATCCLALLLAEAGGELKGVGEDEFFAIVGALVEPRLGAMKAAIATKDVRQLMQELDAIRKFY